MSQTRKMSFVEFFANILVGYGVSFIAQLTVFPLVGVHADIAQNIWIGAAFTVVSLVRSYFVRRFFNSLFR